MTRWGAILICLAGFAVILLLADRVFEHIPHSEDEAAYLFQAKVMAQNRLTVPTPANRLAFWSPFVVDYQGRRFGKYPPGWPALLSLGVRLRAAWLVNAALGTLTLALIFRLGSRLYSPPLGLIGAALALTTPGFLFLSASLLSHTASLFWVMIALVGLTYIRRGRPYPALIVGAGLGAAFVTRPSAGLGAGLAVGFFALLQAIRGRWRWPVLAWFGLGGLPVAALLPLYWWAITGDPTFNPYLLVWPYDRPGFGPDIGPYGYDLRAALFINTRLKLQALATGLFGWPGWSNLLFLSLPFLLPSLPPARGKANLSPKRGGITPAADWLLLGLLLSLIFLHLFYWAFGGVDGGFPRYYYDALPALVLLTGRGMQRAFGWLARYRLGWAVVGLVSLLVAYNFTFNLPSHMAAQKGKYGITPAPLEIVERANLSEPALIIVRDVASWRDFAAPFAANSPTLDGPVVYAIGGSPAHNRRLQAQFPRRLCLELAGERLRPCR